MAAVWDTILHTQLLERRHRLQQAIRASDETAHLVSLLQEVDSTLERIGTPSYGLCDGCHEPIEKERLMADPLVRTCLGCLTAEQQQALEQDLDLASRIQGGLLPRSRNFDGWKICFHYQPAGPVSGDYCDLVEDEKRPGGLFFLLGDVSGKGVAASLLMAHLHAIFRSLIGTGLPVHRLVQQANRIFCGSTLSTHYATLVCGRAGSSGEIELCNAGHCPALLIRGGELSSVGATGLPIGMFGTGQYSAKRFQLAPGDSLLLYTDGVSEAQDATQAQYGFERLARLAAAHHNRPPQALIDACLEDLTAFRGGAPHRDDLTLMALRRGPEAAN
jgi:sigma-B regulation protein RsbU (phosphoserine phosphatase)